MAFTNPLKPQLQAGRRTVGAWLQIASPYTAEIMGRAGFDWVLIDLEHGPGDISLLISQLQALNGSGVTPLVRAPWNDFVVLKRILDAGVSGVLVPYVNTAAEATAAVRACRYPPQGVRGIAGWGVAHLLYTLGAALLDGTVQDTSAAARSGFIPYPTSVGASKSSTRSAG